LVILLEAVIKQIEFGAIRHDLVNAPLYLVDDDTLIGRRAGADAVEDIVDIDGRVGAGAVIVRIMGVAT
jgi:hypothetical protein